MINIKRFIDKVSQLEGRQSRDVVLSIAEARALRDDIAKLLADSYTESKNSLGKPEEVIQVQISGGKW